MTRRTVIGALAAVPLAAAPVTATNRPTLCIFSKHMAQFGHEDLARHAKEIGFEGIDLTVRPKGHVLPENAAQDLPRAVEIIRARGLSVPMITTDLQGPADAAARPTLSTAAKLRIPFWKPGYHRYAKLDAPGAAEKTVAEMRPQLGGLAAMSKEYGITCGVHNHSGDYFGAAVWDIRDVIAPLDPASVGYYFDPAHATIEGGLGNWRISLNLVSSRLKMLAMKDFYWTKGKDGRYVSTWCPIGQGMVDWPRVFAHLRSISFTGPLTLHIEYQSKDELAAIAQDFEFVRKQIDAAWRS